MSASLNSRWLVGCAGWLLIALVGGCQQASAPAVDQLLQAQRDLEAAQQAFLRHDDELALKFIEASIVAHPTPEAYRARAQFRIEQQDFETAEQDIFAGLYLDPENQVLIGLNRTIKTSQQQAADEIAKQEKAEQEKVARAERERMAAQEQAKREADKLREQEQLRLATEKNRQLFAQTFKELPATIDLPLPRGVRAESTTIALPEPPAGNAYGLELVSPRFQLKQEGSEPVWSAIADGPAVGTFAIQPGELVFEWSPRVEPAAADELRNAVLVVTCAGQKHETSLRRPTTLEPVLLDLSKQKIVVPVPAVSIPSDAELQIGFLKIAGFPAAKAINSTAGVKEPLDVIIKDTAPAVILRIQLVERSDTRQINIEPLILDTDNKTYSFTADRIKTMLVTLNRDIPRNKVRLAQLQADCGSLQAEIQRISGIAATDAPEAAAKANALDDLQNKLAGANRNAIKLSQLIPVLENRLKILPSLVAVGVQIHNETHLLLRAFYTYDGREIDVLVMEEPEPKTSPGTQTTSAAKPRS
ncbi:MAG TPA: hypothetical protein VHY20_12700 [Pirellulales bacterium]|jgi:hypothetical protein|nr:hypothetical protein [Pirellulales bacterium]